MGSRMPRRRRTQKDDRGLPLLPVLLGVVFLGFLVGAVPALITGDHDEDTRVAQVAASPKAEPTPIPAATIARLPRRFTPYPAVVPTLVHTPAPPSPTPDDTATDAPTPMPTQVPTQIPTQVPTVHASVPPTLIPTPALTPTILPAQSVTPTGEPITVGPQSTHSLEMVPSSPTIETDSEFAEEAARTVETYLTALQQGDEEKASSALAPGLALSEESFLDRSARITRIHATGTSTAAAVQARVTAHREQYLVTFSVERGPKGPIIEDHTVSKESSSARR